MNTTQEQNNYNIIIKNCNNIDFGEISIAKKKLNIKHGNNGTGKSTIAKAIDLSASKDQTLDELLPFKLRSNNPANEKPEVSGVEEIASVLVFNEEYLANFSFRPNELVENSFDIFINTPAYKEKASAIEAIVGDIKNAFRNEKNLEQLLTDLRELSGNFKLTKTGLSKATTGFKALASGNKCEHVPEGLEGYSAFLRDKNNVQWIDWQQKGQSYIDISDDCPFCALPTTDSKERIVRVSKEYDKNIIKNLTAIINVITKLGKYFSDDTKNQLEVITRLKDGIEQEHETFIGNTKEQIDILIEKLEKLKNISGADFSEVEKVAEKLPGYKIDLSFLKKLDSPETNEITNSLNEKLDGLIGQAGQLQGEINKQRREVERLIKVNQESIDNFLASAGYKYKVVIAPDGIGDYKLRLKHIDFDNAIAGGGQHLSFGEKNAFSLVLFMHECLSKRPDLIILDDPISSFDKYKKYAIIDRLFRQNNSFKGMTTLMLTHDIEPIIDSVKVLHGLFSNISVSSFLKSDDGVVSEQRIVRDDIKTFPQIFKSIVNSDANDITKLIYLRRYYEVLDDKDHEYQVLSNLFKARVDLEDFRRPMNEDGTSPLMEESDVEQGVTGIKKFVPHFEYSKLLETITDAPVLIDIYRNVETGYEKLQIYRLIKGDHNNSVIRKYINEVYHIENDYICQLDPRKFDLIPQYVVEECDKALAE